MSLPPFRSPDKSFLGVDSAEVFAPDTARAVVVPFPLEATVCYGKGTGHGPDAIIAASPELEFFDEELWREPYRDFGIATLESPEVATPVAAALDQIAALAGTVLEADRFPLILGGEHALTAGAVRPFAEKFPNLAVVHLDAHADLRDGYLGEPFSHAASMRRVLDIAGVEIVSIGVRNISAAEAAFLDANRDRVTVHWARERADWRFDEIVRPLRGRPVYLTFDVDAFDAGLMPATGTPEPGGLSWDEACAVLKAVAGAAHIVGADVVEFAPIEGIPAYDFVAARLAYKIMSRALSASG